MNINIEALRQRALRNAAERLELIRDLRELLGLPKPGETFNTQLNAALMNNELAKRIDEADESFLWKIGIFPGDITTHRIATVLTKISQ